MLFNSETYLVFLPAAVLVNWLLPVRARAGFLLLASYVFYAYWNPQFLLLIAGLTVANFLLGRFQAQITPRSRPRLAFAVFVNLLTLAVFKYLGLLDDSARRLGALLHLGTDWPVVHIILPLGLSFFAFEFIHYQVDLFRGWKPIASPVRFALFPAFFPTQIAGPIKRFQDFDTQVGSHPPLDPVLFFEGLELIARGLFKKVVLADNLLPIASALFAAPGSATALDAWAGLLAFSFQIYLDFSGYTDIGRGSAQLLGYRVPENFHAPYLAATPSEFWRRWHVSLSSWLRDYLYIPLGGNRRSPRRVQLNLMLTMALGGLWHGAAWHFVFWGAGHGLLLTAQRALPKWRISRTGGALGSWALTQLLVLLLWDLFRAPSLQAAGTVAFRLVGGGAGLHVISLNQCLLAVEVAIAVLAVQLLAASRDWRGILSSPQAAVVRPAWVLMTGAVCALAAAASQSAHTFIYFQF